jgi:menaquinone-dependent protoporphyrinogen oxidase
MSADRVLVAFSSPTGSTAAIAEAIAAVLLREGLVVECRQARDVADVSHYSAVILGSGVFVPRRCSDGGGFLARHAAALATRPVWLFCAGPIGRGRCANGVVTVQSDCSVMAVAEAVGARGAAVFGPIGMPLDSDPLEQLGPVDIAPVRAWATGIARDLTSGRAGRRIRRSRVHGAPRLAATAT